MQENLEVDPVYVNVRNNTMMVPLLPTVAAITFEMRAKICYGAESPRHHHGFGRGG
jgi:hypothetical protein